MDLCLVHKEVKRRHSNIIYDALFVQGIKKHFANELCVYKYTVQLCACKEELARLNDLCACWQYLFVLDCEYTYWIVDKWKNLLIFRYIINERTKCGKNECDDADATFILSTFSIIIYNDYASCFISISTARYTRSQK